jgi:tRNA(adenine34) deaminase
MHEDEKWMKLAIKQAEKAEQQGEVPVGAILIKDGLLIAQAHNQSITNNDPTAHAEIQLLRTAGSKLQNYRLTETSLYVTLEPCAMCVGAIMHARIKRVVYGTNDFKTGACGSNIDLANNGNFNHKLQVTSGVLEKDCKKILQKFFKKKRH